MSQKCPDCGCTRIWDQDCPECDGSGEDDCPECDGSGYNEGYCECSKCGLIDDADNFDTDYQQ